MVTLKLGLDPCDRNQNGTVLILFKVTDKYSWCKKNQKGSKKRQSIKEQFIYFINQRTK